MRFSPVSLLSAAACLFAASIAAPAETGLSSTPSPTIPGNCYTTMDDFEHTTASVKGPSCYTHTSTVQAASCPTYSCPSKPTDLVCPDYIKVSSVTVPCSTSCCPSTSTIYEPGGPCSTCDPCRIPTEWITYTTGCAGVATSTSKTTVTPA
ncbi:hypothetical protein F5Y15DRAFT_265665 [Xylariaceae sp. FL0016]|nr:hypothetical protein F5Y15DRAFT_265665 [Xylariaceae sp. FL0016]